MVTMRSVGCTSPTRIEQERCTWSLMCTEQAPHCATPQPDFVPIAARLAQAGYRVLRPQPRGIGQSSGPLTGIDLHDYAADVAAVIAHENREPAFVVGHAFGNRVARMLATDRPDLVRAVALV